MLTTNRCMLTRPVAADLAAILELYTSTEVRLYLGGPIDAQAFRERVAPKLLAADGSLYWVIRRSVDQSFLGLISLVPHHDGGDTEVSYQFLPAWWGQGYATEVVARIIAYAIHDVGLPRVVAETQTANTASCRLLENVGMRLERTVTRFGAEQGIFSIGRSQITDALTDRL